MYDTTKITAAGLLLFTGADAASSDVVIDILSKLGMIGVLWLWLRDLKIQLKDQVAAFDKETDEIRSNYQKIIENLKLEYNDYKDRIDKQSELRHKEIEDLRNKLYDILRKYEDNK